MWTTELDALAAGGTRVTCRIALGGGRWQRLLYALAGRRVRAQVEANLRSFARVAGEASSEPPG